MLARSLVQKNLVKNFFVKRYNATLEQASPALEDAKINASSPALESLLPNYNNPPIHTLITTKSFPSLEPNSFIPIPSGTLYQPLRKDVLYEATYFEENAKKEGTILPGRSAWHFSRKKLLPQKGTGKARTGDGNSPIRFNGANALGRSEPNNPKTEIPLPLYQKAFNIALSYQYKCGKLNIIGENYGDKDSQFTAVKENEAIDFNTIPDALKINDVSDIENMELILIKFLDSQKLNNLPKILFVAREKESLVEKASLLPSLKNKIKVVDAESLEVTDILKAHRIYMDLLSLEYVATTNVIGVTI
ncbi:hypothetical protein QEN19_001085 [Hanseniaspora menglaensis]